MRVPGQVVIFSACPAHGNDAGTRVDCVIDGSEQVYSGIVVSNHEQNVGARCDGVRPLDVQRGFKRPIRINNPLPLGINDRQATGGQTKLSAEVGPVSLGAVSYTHLTL